MKIHITENLDKLIDGYTMMPIVYGKIDMSNVPNNCATDVIASDAIDSIFVDDIINFFEQVVSKIRLNGKLFVSGTDLCLLAQDIISGAIKCQDFNKLTTDKRSIYPVDDIVKIISSMGLKIDSVEIKGNKYEIRAIRSN
jgi:hypothetical protein